MALRGSSMGGWQAIHAAALDTEIEAVVAICPAPEDVLLRGVRAGTLEGFAYDAAAMEPWLSSLDVYAAAAQLGPAHRAAAAARPR